MKKLIQNLAWILVASPLLLAAKQHAMVVGINQYQYAGQRGLENLEGAVNDANLLAQVLRQAGVDLPKSRVLLDHKATRSNLLRAWEALVNSAQPGDTLILTYAGHGGQEQDNGPLDETGDHKDETLMLHDFNPHHPEQGRINDDELRQWFEKAQAFRLVVLLDACHSGGLVRGAKTRGRSRSGGAISYTVSLPVFPSSTAGDEGKQLPPYLTLITASHSDSLTIDEIVIQGQDHGALSWNFAQALQGAADRNQDGTLDRREIRDYLQHWIPIHTNHSQTPALLPEENAPVFTLRRNITTTEQGALPSAVILSVEEGKPPAGLRHMEQHRRSYALRFHIKGQNVTVYNQRGDHLTTLPNQRVDWQRVIDKERLRQALATRYNQRLRPVEITLREGDGLHRKGQSLHFSVTPRDLGLTALTLFNLAGNGELQWLYPLQKYQDPLRLRHFPYHLPKLKVGPPYGGDHLIAILCDEPPVVLHRLLAGRADPPSPSEVDRALLGFRCQMGQYGFFTRK